MNWNKGFFVVVILLLTHINGYSQSVGPKYEFRAAWVATVENIDWPTRRGMSSDEQKKEFIRLADMHKANGMNALVVQVRPVADAFYPSQYEPWSEYLSGKQGVPPSPYYDPLEFMITETHKRGMEFHAWINPYRAVFNVERSSVAPNHVTKINPQWFLTYGDKKYFDPAIPEVRNYVSAVIRDLVKRYDLDAVHFDDYFYPYRIAGKEFPDAASFKKYGNGMDKEDWRRSNVDSIIYQLHETIRSEKPYVKFGISPFGVWRNIDKDPIGSPTRAGQTNYDDLYADVLLWLKKGWIDYVAPQLYWEISHTLAPYTPLLNWWAKYGYGRHIYIGHGFYRAGSNTAWKDKNELPRQIQLLREKPEVQGSVYFSSKSFINNPNGWSDSLKMTYYAKPALVPAMPWIDSIKPAKPELNQVIDYEGDAMGQILIIEAKNLEKKEAVKAFTVYGFPDINEMDTENTEYLLDIIPVKDNLKFSFRPKRLPEHWMQLNIAVGVVDRNNNESAMSNTITLYRSKTGNWVVKK